MDAAVWFTDWTKDRACRECYDDFIFETEQHWGDNNLDTYALLITIRALERLRKDLLK